MDKDYNFEEFRNYKRQAIKAARDLNYGDEVISDIRAAKKDSEIITIMANARRKKFR